jgi:hypothetical protein
VNVRAISTVLDASLCLLLVTASVLTLVGTPVVRESGPSADTSDRGPQTADQTAETLATSTARVTYRVGDRNRTVHDTLAGLLASAVLADPTATSTPAFTAAVTERVVHVVRRAEVGVQVIARPTAADASTDNRVVAGAPPPPAVDVHAAAFAVRRVRLIVRTWRSAP